MSMADTLMGYEALSPRNTRGQVYMATHKGELRLPFMNRSFISFSFGGKYIEDFSLIATIENNRLNRNASAEFEDLVDSYNILDGQFYWGTHYKPNKITFKLATDGILQAQLDDFKHWFAGGKTRELILAEHPNRAILARVSSPPAITLLPFEEPTTVQIAGATYHTSTTKYKGEITLEFVMDLPFWYSKINIFGHYDASSNEYIDEWWDDARQEYVNVFNSYNNMDVMKIVIEDNIPISSMITSSMLLGNNTFADLQSNSGVIANNTTFTYIYDNPDVDGGIIARVGYIDKYNMYFMDAITVNKQDEYIAPITLSSNTGELDETSVMYLINAINKINGTSLGYDTALNTILLSAQSIAGEIVIDSAALEEAKITEAEALDDLNKLSQYTTTLPLALFEDTNLNSCIFNESTQKGAKIAGPHMAEDTGIETMAPGDEYYFYYAGTAPSLPELQFTLTPVFNSDGFIISPYNSHCITQFTDDGFGITYNTITIESLTKHEFRFTTPNLYTAYNEAIRLFRGITTLNQREWMYVRNLIRDNVKHYAVRNWANTIIDGLNTDIINSSDLNTCITNMLLFFKDNNGDIISTTFIFNSETGQARGQFKYRVPTTESPNYSYLEAEEDVSDMIKSPYLIIMDRNHPNDMGKIVERTNTNSDTKTYCHSLTHNVQNGLEHVFIKYKNMYL